MTNYDDLSALAEREHRKESEIVRDALTAYIATRA
jgi:predicted transcriptional regulator